MSGLTPKKPLSSPTAQKGEKEEAAPIMPSEEGSGRLASFPSGQSLTGQTIERYTLEALIGKGGMGEVYRALDGRLRRKVALKVLRADKERPDAVARLFREARAAAALTHPNAVAIHDIGESEGLFYIVMELVNGMPLLAYVGDDRIPLARKLRWLADISRALVCAHKAGVIHRDVKPSNVMVSEEDVAKVLDFGLAKPVEPKSIDFKTAVGRVVGTLRYMSPEQLSGADADARSDQYALGVTAYELISGRYPGGHPLAVPPPLDEVVTGFPKDGARVIAKMMELEPNKRFGSMNDIVTALEDVAAGRPIRVSLPVPKDGGLAGVSGGGAGAGAGAGAGVKTPPDPKRKSRPSMADTVRDPGLSPSAVTETVAPAKPDEIPDDRDPLPLSPAKGENTTAPLPKIPPPAPAVVGENTTAPLPILGGKTMPSGATPLPPSLEARFEAHARAHQVAARTLLSHEKPRELAEMIVADRARRSAESAVTTAPATKAPGPSTMQSPAAGKNRPLQETPTTLPVKNNQAQGKAQAHPQLQPNAPTPGPSPSPLHGGTLPLGTSSPPARAISLPNPSADAVDPPVVLPKRSNSLTIVIVVVAILAIAAFLGTYFGSRARQGSTPAIPSAGALVPSAALSAERVDPSSEVIPAAPLSTPGATTTSTGSAAPNPIPTTPTPTSTVAKPVLASACSRARAERASGRPNATLDAQCRATGGNPMPSATAFQLGF
jgi:serine/threonine protein kinase